MRGLRRGGAPPGRDGRHGAASTARRNQRHAGGFDKDGRRHRRARSSHCPRRSRYLDSDGGWYKTSEDRTDGPGCYYYRGADGEGGRGQGGEAKSDESRSLGAGSGRGAWQVQILIVGTCMLLCNLDRVAMGILAVPLIQEFSLSMTQLGVLQSSYLWGYLIGQLPAGLASDRYGGVPVMLVGLLVWSLATCGTALAKFSANPLSMVAGMAALNALDQAAFDRLEALGNAVRARLAAAIEATNAPFCVTGAASLFRIHPRKNEPRNFRDTYLDVESARLMRRLGRHFLRNGILLPFAAAASLSTPCGHDEVDMIADVFSHFLEEYGNDFTH